MRSLNDPTLDRSFNYDHVGRLQTSFSGSAARAHVGVGSSWASDGPYAMHDNVYDVWGNMTSRTGWGGDNPSFTATYTNNKRNGLTFDAAGNLINDVGLNYTYDATGQQATASYSGYYNGEGLRVKKSETGTVTL